MNYTNPFKDNFKLGIVDINGKAHKYLTPDKIVEMLKHSGYVSKYSTIENLTVLGNVVFTEDDLFTEIKECCSIYFPANITSAQYDWLDNNFNCFTDSQKIAYSKFINKISDKIERPIPNYKKIFEYTFDELTPSKFFELHRIWNDHYFTETKREFLGLSKADFINFLKLDYNSFIEYLRINYFSNK